jgi:hypothetical protein
MDLMFTVLGLLGLTVSAFYLLLVAVIYRARRRIFLSQREEHENDNTD